MIILEGPDGMGKSTLADQLTAPGTATPKLMKFVCQRRHRIYAELLSTIVDCQHRAFLHGVQDRVAQISEYVYGRLNGRALVSDNTFELFQRRLVERAHPVIIYCRLQNLEAAAPTREADETEDEHRHVLQTLGRLRDAYDSLLFGSTFRDAHVIPFDYTRDDADDLVQGLPVLVNAVAERQARVELKRTEDKTEQLRKSLPTDYVNCEEFGTLVSDYAGPDAP